MTEIETKILDTINSIPETTVGYCATEVLKLHNADVKKQSEKEYNRGYAEAQQSMRYSAWSHFKSYASTFYNWMIVILVILAGAFGGCKIAMTSAEIAQSWDKIYKQSSIDCSLGKKAECLQSYAREWVDGETSRARSYEMLYKGSTKEDLINPLESVRKEQNDRVEGL